MSFTSQTDDEIIKFNVYTEKGTHYFNDKYRQTTLNKNYIIKNGDFLKVKIKLHILFLTMLRFV